MKKLLQKIYLLPFYIQMQIWVRIPSETSKQWNKWQPTRKQSLSEFVDYELEFSPIPTKAIASRMWLLIILVPILVVLLSSCSSVYWENTKHTASGRHTYFEPGWGYYSTCKSYSQQPIKPMTFKRYSY